MYKEINSEYFLKNEKWHVEDSPWKAQNIFKLMKSNKIKPNYVVEIGCGAGEILNQLYEKTTSNVYFEGYDISPDAYKMCKNREKDRLKFFNEDLITKDVKKIDLLLMIDVFEHVDDYISFIKECSKKSLYTIYHIPLDLSVSALLRNTFFHSRFSVGHLHYFSKETAILTLKDSGLEIIDYFYTAGAVERNNSRLKTRFINIFRLILFKVSPDFCVRLLGGYSLMILTRSTN